MEKKLFNFVTPTAETLMTFGSSFGIWMQLLFTGRVMEMESSGLEVSTDTVLRSVFSFPAAATTITPLEIA